MTLLFKDFAHTKILKLLFNYQKINVKILWSRSPHFFSSEKLNDFNIKLSFENKSVTDYKLIQLHLLKKYVFSINARHNIQNATKIDSDEFEGLSSLLHTCEGTHVMVTRNLWVEKGLFNGSMDVVRNIIYQDGQRPSSWPLTEVVETLKQLYWSKFFSVL